MKRTLFIPILILILSMPCAALANNVKLTNVGLVNKNTLENTYDIRFDVSWDNSWYAADPADANVVNWDAVWVFAKYQVDGTTTWTHCTLLTNQYHEPNNISMEFGNTAGIFLHRDSAGTGSIDIDGVRVGWSYNGIASDNIKIHIKVFAVEMVFIPQGSFYLGDGGNALYDSTNHFYDANDSADPRDAILIGSTAPYVSNVYDGSGIGGDITWYPETSRGGTHPAARTQIDPNYPTGYEAFYIMKNELSCQQYVDFLNCLTRTQQAERVYQIVAGKPALDIYDDANTEIDEEGYRPVIFAPKFVPSAPTPVTFVCDYNQNGQGGEPDDGQWQTCNALTYADGAAWDDWAGLRPMTELEFEKAARGSGSPVNGEYSWGDDNLITDGGILYKGTEREVPVSGTARVCASHLENLDAGPMRCGCFATASSDRLKAGASYWGVLDLSGQNHERPVGIMASQFEPTLSLFRGTHGDGVLSEAGNHTNSDWPDPDTEHGVGFRGGDWANPAAGFCPVSQRKFAVYDPNALVNVIPYRHGNMGNRGVRSAFDGAVVEVALINMDGIPSFALIIAEKGRLQMQTCPIDFVNLLM